MTTPAPPTADTEVLRRVSPIMPTPNIVEGLPQNWLPSRLITEDWGSLGIYANGVDVTFVRGVRTRVLSWSYTEPFGYGPAQLNFPRLTTFDAFGGINDPADEYAISHLRNGFNAEIVKRPPGGGAETVIWEGFCHAVEFPADGSGMNAQCMGALYQATLEPKQPRWFDAALDIGTVVADALNAVPGRRYAAMTPVTTGILTRNRGSWQTTLDYVQELLSTAYNNTQTQWTVKMSAGRVPSLVLKDRTTSQWIVSNGQPGCVLAENTDLAASTNVIYGEGTDEATGCRWRNSRYPGDLDEPVFVALAAYPENVPFTYDTEVAGGWEANAAYVPTQLRVARYHNYGSGITLAEGKSAAFQELYRDGNAGWQGTLELTADPEQGSRFDIRAGDNIAVRYHHGHPSRRMHIAKVDVALDDPGYKVTLTVDTNDRDAITVAGIRSRDREAATDPARRLNPPRRRSRNTPDEHPIFDCEAGAGRLTGWSVTGGAWNVRRVPFAAYGSIVRSYFTTSAATTFACGLFDRPVSTGTLGTLVGDPLAVADPWDTQADALSDAGLQVAWGGSAQRGGYYPSQQGKAGATVTGRMLDDASWDYAAKRPPWMYLAFYPAASTTVTAKFDAAPES